VISNLRPLKAFEQITGITLHAGYVRDPNDVSAPYEEGEYV
jgi:hypothetical protein